MLKLFLATLLPSLLALPLLLAFADDAPPRRAATDDAGDAGSAPTLLAMAPAESIISPLAILP